VTRSLLLSLQVLVLACGSARLVDDGVEDTGEATGEATDASTGEPPLEPFGPYVDCAMLGAGEPTVAPDILGPFDLPIYACNPRSSGVSDSGHRCCSSDPATADGRLPAYVGKDIDDASPPLYADAANAAGTWGMCVRTSEIPDETSLRSGAAEGCPIPCNPTWSADQVTEVCGSNGAVCCQAFELGARDCVQDAGTWRPVTGADIGNPDVVPTTAWNNASHDTHQDPSGTVCLAASGGEFDDAFTECIRHLGVADQRGFCMFLSAGEQCGAAAPSYVDACEAKN
jgi:hypothetical protein